MKRSSNGWGASTEAWIDAELLLTPLEEKQQTVKLYPTMFQALLDTQ